MIISIVSQLRNNTIHPLIICFIISMLPIKCNWLLINIMLLVKIKKIY